MHNICATSNTSDSGRTIANTEQGFSPNGYNPQLGERTLDGYVRNNTNPEISSTTQSAGFNNNNGNVSGVTSPSTKDVKQLYEYLNNGKYQ